MTLTASQRRILGAHLFAWAVQQARLRAYLAEGWNGPPDDVRQLVVFALRNVA